MPEGKEIDERIGNTFHLLVKKPGRPKKYTPDILWDKFAEYVEWAGQNPHVFDKNSSRDRPLTIGEFCAFADIDTTTFENYLSKQDTYKDYFRISERIKAIIDSQKLSGAIAGMYKENIVARLLGLVDKKETKHEGEVKVKQTTEEMEKELAELRRQRDSA